jgi:hypothetical protein
MERTRSGRIHHRRERFDLLARLDRLEARIARLEKAVAKMAESESIPIGGEASCCDDLIGCLDDCVEDVAALRKKVRNVRR